MSKREMTRAECLRLLARQLATLNGQIWTKLPAKVQDRWQSAASGLLATVERLADVSWHEQGER